MLAVTLLAVGKLKESYLTEAVAEYRKRLAAFCRFDLVELPESRLPQSPSETEIEKALQKEGGAILERIPPRARVIALCIEGRGLSSEELAASLAAMSGEASHVVFVVGSSHGLGEDVKRAAHLRLSMSAMTFPHQLARVMLCEQLYRALSINAGGKYHK